MRYTLVINDEAYTCELKALKSIELDFKILAHSEFLKRYYELFSEVSFYEDDFPFDDYGNITGINLALHSFDVVRKPKGTFEIMKNILTEDISIRKI